MKHILLIDDDTDLLDALQSFLRKKGYTVTTETSCTAGLKLFFSDPPDLVLLDLNVGEEDGRVMCRDLKARAESAHTPVIMISANHDELRRHHEFGADAALNKPFDLVKLTETIDVVLNKLPGKSDQLQRNEMH
jgi:two-component system phosphate regulon response regulator PhoB